MKRGRRKREKRQSKAARAVMLLRGFRWASALLLRDHPRYAVENYRTACWMIARKKRAR